MSQMQQRNSVKATTGKDFKTNPTNPNVNLSPKSHRSNSSAGSRGSKLGAIFQSINKKIEMKKQQNLSGSKASETSQKQTITSGGLSQSKNESSDMPPPLLQYLKEKEGDDSDDVDIEFSSDEEHEQLRR